MPFIRKHAAALAALFALLCAAAAPYMIPENPDSAVFRSGTLGLILLCAAALPAQTALRRADRRTLCVSLALGCLFALALSLGSELYIYDGLLRGFGSLVRRMAVPVMAAPLLGALIARLLMPADRAPASRPPRLPLWSYALILFVCWVPLLLAYFPGMLNYDFIGEFNQHLTGEYSNLHPLLHSAIMNGVIALGEALHSRSLGVLLMSLLQMALLALALGYACAFVQRRGAGRGTMLALTALFALHPVFSVMSVSMTKDTLFAAAFLTLSLLTFELLEQPEAFLHSRRRCALFIVTAVGTALLRNNGLFALALLLPGAVIAARGMRRGVALLSGASIAACVLTTALLTLVYAPQTMPSFQLYSLPAQQLVRACSSGKLSEEDRAEIAGWYVSEEGLIVHEHLADAAKGYLDRERIEAEGDKFLKLWARHAGACAHEYLEAFLMLNVGSWYPDDRSHATIYPDATWSNKGYLQTQEYDMTAEGITTRCFLPAVRDLCERICRSNEGQEIPVLSVLLCTATPFWALLLAVAALIARRRTRLMPAALGGLGLWLSYLFGACTLPRYALPLFALAPALLAVALRSPARKEEPACSD